MSESSDSSSTTTQALQKCTFSKFGCTLVLNAAELDQHLQQAAQHHLSLVLSRYRLLQSDSKLCKEALNTALMKCRQVEVQKEKLMQDNKELLQLVRELKQQQTQYSDDEEQTTLASNTDNATSTESNPHSVNGESTASKSSNKDGNMIKLVLQQESEIKRLKQQLSSLQQHRQENQSHHYQPLFHTDEISHFKPFRAHNIFATLMPFKPLYNTSSLFHTFTHTLYSTGSSLTTQLQTVKPMNEQLSNVQNSMKQFKLNETQNQKSVMQAQQLPSQPSQPTQPTQSTLPTQSATLKIKSKKPEDDEEFRRLSEVYYKALEVLEVDKQKIQPPQQGQSPSQQHSQSQQDVEVKTQSSSHSNADLYPVKPNDRYHNHGSGLEKFCPAIILKQARRGIKMVFNEYETDESIQKQVPKPQVNSAQTVGNGTHSDQS